MPTGCLALFGVLWLQGHTGAKPKMLPSGVDGMPRTGGQTRLGSEGKEAPYGGPVRGDVRSGVLDSRAILLWPSPPPSDHLPWAGRLFLLSHTCSNFNYTKYL